MGALSTMWTTVALGGFELVKLQHALANELARRPVLIRGRVKALYRLLTREELPLLGMCTLASTLRGLLASSAAVHPSAGRPRHDELSAPRRVVVAATPLVLRRRRAAARCELLVRAEALLLALGAPPSVACGLTPREWLSEPFSGRSRDARYQAGLGRRGAS